MSDEGEAPVLLRWLEGSSIREIAGATSRRAWKAGEDIEHRLRVELAAFQVHVIAMERACEDATNQRNAMAESAKKLHLLMGVYGEQAAEVGLCFGEWPEVDATPLGCGCLPSRHHFWRGYLCGKGAQATREQRAFDKLGNVVRLRATADNKAGT